MARVTGVTEETGPGGFPFLVVDTERCRARLTPYGAQVCEWTPAGQPSSVLFLSPRAVFAAGKAIRGGVPLCFPWFGNHPTDPRKPSHGFARTRTWRIGETTRDEAGDVRVTLHLTSDDATRALWDAAFAATLTVTLGASLALTFEAENAGAEPIVYEIALHTYLAVGDVTKVRIHGLEHTRFLDKVDGSRGRRSGAEPLTFTGDTDRVFLDTTAPCEVDDPVLGRRIVVTKEGSPVTVVWNPGRAKGEAVADIGDAWRRFVCVEAASCAPHAVHLAPGARQAINTRIEVAPPG